MVAVSVVWAWMLNKDFGLINSLLRLLGISKVAWLTNPRMTLPILVVLAIWKGLGYRVILFLAGLQVNSLLRLLGISKVAWLTNPRMTLPILVVLAIWKGLGYRVILFLAGLQGIDPRYYAAARMDGARSFQRFLHVTIPMLKPTLVFLSITTVIDVFKTFDEVYVMYANEPGPLKSGLTIVFYIFTKFYRHWEFASAAAAAFVLFLIIFAVTLLQFFLTNRRRKEAAE